jgi:hypothetical protein
VQRQTPFYILTNDDMDRIGYQIRDSTEELWEEATKKQEEQQKKVQDQLGVLQHMLEDANLTKEHRSMKNCQQGQGEKQKACNHPDTGDTRAQNPTD